MSLYDPYEEATVLNRHEAISPGKPSHTNMPRTSRGAREPEIVAVVVGAAVALVVGAVVALVVGAAVVGAVVALVVGADVAEASRGQLTLSRNTVHLASE